MHLFANKKFIAKNSKKIFLFQIKFVSLQYKNKSNSMNKFNLNKALEIFGQGLDRDWLAESLFPKNKYPKVAFARVLKGENELSVSQLEVLAECLCVAPQDLFGLDDWKTIANTPLTLTKEGYTVRFREPNANCAALYKDNKLFTSVVIPGIPTIKDFIALVETTINTYNKNNGNNQN